MNKIIFCFLITLSYLSGTEFTISSYNCGGLSDHYDYLRAASMEKLMQERHIAEPEYMSLNEKIQKIALKILFSKDVNEKALAKEEWEQKGYQQLLELLTEAPSQTDSLNKKWYHQAESMITSYNIRPVVIDDKKVNQMLDQHLANLCKTSALSRPLQLQNVRNSMAEAIFRDHLNYDIICLQEADYLTSTLFPDTYEVLFSESTHSKNGIAWNKERFELVNCIGDILGRAYAVQFSDKETGKIIVVASGHLTGCDPFRLEKSSVKGDRELQAIVDLFDNCDADLRIIGMDSNVTSLHPRLNILKNANYQLDYENYLEPTCTNPYQVLNTRIDWISLKSTLECSITNIPVLSVGLNSIQTNMSDHKPIAAKISY